MTPIDTYPPFVGRISRCQILSPNGPYLLTPTAIHVHPVQDRSMRRHWQPNWIASNHGSISCTSNSVCVFIVFAIYPKLLKFFLLCCLYSTGITPTHPFTFNPLHHGPYQDLVYHQDSFAESYPRNDPSYRNDRLLVPERTTVRSIRDVPPERRTTRFLLSLIRPTCLPIVRRLEP